ncbi:MAG TPA: hypothetical protein VLT83_07475 [Opitutaceae bacterium]|nr:hypothetical protein [Opitutaceae bacterium]
MFTCAHFVRKGVQRAKQYSEEAQRNPQLAAISLAASLHPDIEIVSKDEAAGKITLRNKKTGQVVTLDTNDLSSGNMSRALERFSKGLTPMPGASATVARETPPAPTEAEAAPAEEKPAEPSISPARAAAQTAVMKKFPDFIPSYGGAKTLDSTINSFAGNTVGSYRFETSDSPETVADFYEKKFTAAGLTVLTRQNGSNNNGATAALIAQHAGSQTTVSFQAEVENGKTQGTIGFTRAGGQ